MAFPRNVVHENASVFEPGLPADIPERREALDWALAEQLAARPSDEHTPDDRAYY
jgi:hypothetical protein